jgi:hypothetical protein
MYNRIPLEEIYKNLFDNHNGTISMTNYSNLGNKAHFICNVCGNEWDTEANSVIKRGHGCKICSFKNTDKKIKRKFTNEEVDEFIRSQNCIWESGEYKNIDSHLKIKFSCGHIDDICYGNFRTGSRCRICGRKQSGMKQRRPEQEIFDLLEEFGFNFIDFPNGYNNTRSEVRYECELGHITTRSVSVLKRGPTCKECKNQERVILSRNSIEHVVEIM